MDKSDVKVHESQSDTSSVITMKEYAPSEYPSSEPPPAYMKPRSNALRIATLLAFTVIVSSIILGGFLLAASWIQANTARNLDLTLNQELLDDLHPSYDHLVANEILPEQQHNSVEQEVTKNEAKDYNQSPSNSGKVVDKTNDKSIDENLLPPPPPPSPSAKTEEKKVLDLDEIANILMQKNIKGNVNCIVEKRRNEELVDHAPMSLNLPSGNSPFGLNITTPPRLQHLTGEQMIVICKGDEDEEKDSDSDEEGDEDDGKVDQFQSIVLPLPSHLLNQIQQVPQIIPLNQILQHLPVQQIPMQVPVQQVPVQQVPIQQIPIQQITIPQFPQHQPQPPQQPQQIIFQQPQPQQQPQIIYQQQPQQQQQPQIIYQQQPQQQQHQIIYQQQPQQQMFIVEQQQQQPQPQPQPQQQMILPQRLLFPQQQIVNNVQPNIPFAPEMIPLKEVRINQERIPVNHVLHHRVPINPMAVNDIPIARMPITHLPMRAEPQIREEPVPVHHLMPPQPQQYQAENFKQEEPRFNGPIVQEPMNRFPFSQPQPQPNQPRLLPVEVRDPGVLRMPGPIVQEPERYPMPPPANQFFSNMLPENREPELLEEAPNRGFHQPIVDVRSRGQRREPIIPEMPKMNPMIPMNFERRPQGNGRRIRFPEMVDSEEVRENRLPIITEITKIIPIRLEKEESEVNETPMIPLNPNTPPKNVETPEIKIEKIQPRPFPIPINAILDMIFRGIRPLMNNRGHPLPIPIDIKIERIENKPLGLLNTPPFIKKFEIIKKVAPNPIVNDEASQNSNVESVSEEKTENENVPDKGVVEAKVERVEIFDRENENGQPIPIPADAQDPQIFKIEDAGKQSEVSEAGSFEDEAFLPNGQGRGARVFPIPQRVKEAEIFSVFDAKSDKNVEAEVPMESSITVMNPEREKAPETPAENGQGIHLLPTPLLNFFPLSEDKVEPMSKVRPQTFTVPESRSVKLYPVPNTDFKTEEMKPMDSGNVEENRPHFVQPRSV